MTTEKEKNMDKTEEFLQNRLQLEYMRMQTLEHIVQIQQSLLQHSQYNQYKQVYEHHHYIPPTPKPTNYIESRLNNDQPNPSGTSHEEIQSKKRKSLELEVAEELISLKPSKKKFKPRLCSVAGCRTQDKGNGLCAKHGGGKCCAFEGCTKIVAGCKYCSQHGGSRKKRCANTMDHCTKFAQYACGYCAKCATKFSVGRQCKTEGCTKRPVSMGLCWACGGGKRCSMKGCRRSPKSHGLCKVHCDEEDTKGSHFVGSVGDNASICSHELHEANHSS